MLSRSLDVHKQVPLKDVLSFLVLLRDIVCKILLSRSAKAPKQKKRVCQRVKEEEVENSDNEYFGAASGWVLPPHVSKIFNMEGVYIVISRTF